MTRQDIIELPNDALVVFGSNPTVWRKIHYSEKRDQVVFTRPNGMFSKAIAVPLSQVANIRPYERKL